MANNHDENGYQMAHITHEDDEEALLGFQRDSFVEDQARITVQKGFDNLQNLYDNRVISRTEYNKRSLFLEEYKRVRYEALEIDESDCDSDDSDDSLSCNDRFQDAILMILEGGQIVWRWIENWWYSKATRRTTQRPI